MLALTCLPMVALWSPAPLAAQTVPAPTSEAVDYDSWERLAALVEEVLNRGTASNALLGSRRSDLARWRARFLTEETANAASVNALQSQLDALGPVPEDGTEEAPEIADRRAALQQSLAEAAAPGQRATEALNRANALISEIDAILLERQTEALMEVEPSPLNPVRWAETVTALAELYVSQYAQTAARLSAESTRAAMARNAPAIIAMILIGLALVVKGRVIVARLGDRFLDADSRRGRTALGFVVSLGQMLLPVIGIILIVTSLEMSGALTQTAQRLSQAVLVLIVVAYAALWLAGRLFPKSNERTALFEVPQEDRASARRVILLIGLFTGLLNGAEVIAGLDLMPPDTRGVLVLPFQLSLAWMFWRFARLLLQTRDLTPEGDSPSFSVRLAVMAARALVVVAIAGSVLTVAGYLNAAEAVMVPTATTLFILGVLLALQPVIRDLHSVIFGVPFGEAKEALLPVLVDFTLALAALPLLAVVWGVRPERLGEFYSRVLQGFTLGDSRITPGIIFAVILIFAAGILLTRILQGALKTTILPRTRMDVGARNAISAGVGYVGIALASVIAVTSAGIDLTALGFVLGALSVGIGFGLQNVVSNFVSGIILLIERPISEGDWIEVAGNMGFVKDISVRSTTIETFDKTDVIVPNADFISGTVTNYTRGNTVGRILITVGVAYGSDTRRVSDILMEIAEGHPDVASVPPPGVDFMGFGADSLDFRVRCILRDILLLNPTTTELNHQIAERFAAEGIEIPFAQRDIWLRNPEALAASASQYKDE